MRRRALTLVVVLATLPLAACNHGGADADAFIVTVRGTAKVAGAHTATYHGGRHQLAVGDTLEVTAGTATLSLPKKASIELRSGRNDSTVKVAAEPTIVDGDALAVAGTSGLRVRAGSATIRLVGGAAHLRRSSGVTLAVYEGAATVDALGQQLVTPALRQAAISDTGALPVHPVPLVYDRSHPDPWDVRYLGDAIDLGTQLDRRSRALTAELAAPSSDAAFLASVVPPLREQPGFGDALVDRNRSVGETVVGASIALGGTGDFVRRWISVFGFRQEGADWGLVALDQQARRSAVFGVLDGVLNAAPATFVSATPRPRVGSTTTSTTAARRSPSSSSTTTTTAPPPAAPTTLPPLTVPVLPQPAPAPSSPSSPSSPPTTTVPNPLQQLLGPVLGGLERPTEGDDRAVPSQEWTTPSGPRTSRESSSRRHSGGSTSTRSVRSSHR